jgi:hypothetical protein
MRDIFEAASQSWKQNVEGFDVNKQLGIVRSMQKLFQGAKSAGDRTVGGRINGRRWGLVFVGITLVIMGIVLWLRRRLEGSAPDAKISEEMARSIELYRRLERVLDLRGVGRPPATPPLAHARALRSAGHPVGNEACALTEIYLRARYGNEPITEQVGRDFLERVEQLRRARFSEAVEAA